MQYAQITAVRNGQAYAWLIDLARNDTGARYELRVCVQDRVLGLNYTGNSRRLALINESRVVVGSIKRWLEIQRGGTISAPQAQRDPVFRLGWRDQETREWKFRDRRAEKYSWRDGLPLQIVV